jgi:hypothetical protein
MTPLATNTFGRVRFFRGRKEHRIPKSATKRYGKRTGARMMAKTAIRQEVKYASI